MDGNSTNTHAEEPALDPSPVKPDPSLRLDRRYLRRPRDWRRQRAQELVATGKRPRRDRDDQHVAAATAFLKAEAAGPKRRPRRKPNRTAVEIRTAQEIFQANDQRRWALEAWLLTREPIAVAAERAGVPAGVACWYARLFFDLDERLNAPGFITHEVIGSQLHFGLSPQDVGLLWKLFAYWCGPHVLQVVLDHYQAAGHADYQHLLDETLRTGKPIPPADEVSRAIWIRLLPMEWFVRYLTEIVPLLVSLKQEAAPAAPIVQPDLEAAAAAAAKPTEEVSTAPAAPAQPDAEDPTRHQEVA